MDGGLDDRMGKITHFSTGLCCLIYVSIIAYRNWNLMVDEFDFDFRKTPKNSMEGNDSVYMVTFTSVSLRNSALTERSLSAARMEKCI